MGRGRGRGGQEYNGGYESIIYRGKERYKER